MNGIIRHAFESAAIPTVREPPGICGDNLMRPDGITAIPWNRGKCIAWDFTCPDSFAESHVRDTAKQAGAAARTAEINKTAKYAGVSPLYTFVPIGLETSGVWGKEGLQLIQEIGHRLELKTKDARSTSFLLQRLSIGLQRGNAQCILNSVPRNYPASP